MHGTHFAAVVASTNAQTPLSLRVYPSKTSWQRLTKTSENEDSLELQSRVQSTLLVLTLSMMYDNLVLNTLNHGMHMVPQKCRLLINIMVVCYCLLWRIKRKFASTSAMLLTIMTNTQKWPTKANLYTSPDPCQSEGSGQSFIASFPPHSLTVLPYEHATSNLIGTTGHLIIYTHSHWSHPTWNSQSQG